MPQWAESLFTGSIKPAQHVIKTPGILRERAVCLSGLEVQDAKTYYGDSLSLCDCRHCDYGCVYAGRQILLKEEKRMKKYVIAGIAAFAALAAGITFVVSKKYIEEERG